MDKFNTKRYIDHLQNIVSTYNCKINRSIKMSPNKAYLEKNYSTVMKNLEKHYRSKVNAKKNPKYKVGDLVRIYITSKEGVFRKGYKPSFTDEVFTITQLDTRLPVPRYFLSDAGDNAIIGSFQAHELSIVGNV